MSAQKDLSASPESPSAVAKKPPFKEVLTLAILLALALATRLTGLNWDQGLSGHSDERNVMGSVERISFGEGFNLDPGFYVYGGLPVYTGKLLVHWTEMAQSLPLLAIFCLSIFLLGFLLLLGAAARDSLPPPLQRVAKRCPNWLRQPPVALGLMAFLVTLGFLALHPIAADYKYIVIRAQSALAGSLTVPAVFLIARRLAGYTPALFAGLFLSFAPLHIQQSHFGTVDVFLACLVAWLMLAVLRYYEKPTISRLLAVTIPLGLALATKTSGVMVGLPVALAIILAHPPQNVDAAKRFGLHSGLGLVVTFTFAFIGAPYTFLKFSDFRGAMEFEGNVVFGTFVPSYTTQFYGETPAVIGLQTLVDFGLGPALGWLTIFGSCVVLATALFRLRQDLLLLLSYALPYAITIIIWDAQFIRYHVPLLTFYVIFAAIGPRLTCREANKIGRYATTGVLAAATIATVVWAGAYLHTYSTPFTRYQASTWIYENVPAGSGILHEAPWDEALPLSLPGRSNGQYRMLSSMKDVTTLSHVDVNRFRSERAAGDERPIPDLASKITQADYVVLSSKRIMGQLMNVPTQYPVSATFYRLLFSGALGYDLVQVFTDYPKIPIIGTVLNDDHIEESWQTNDRAKVFIFRRREQVPQPVIENMLRKPPRELANLDRMTLLTAQVGSIQPISIDLRPYQNPETIITQFRGQSLAQLQLNEPRDIEVDDQGRVYIADFRNFRIIRTDPQMQADIVIGFGKGDGDFYFNDPCGITVDPSNNIIVADTWNWRVQKFSSEGRLLWTLRDLYAPRGVATDQDGNIYITEAGHGKVIVASPQGRRIREFGFKGSGEHGAFLEPVGIAVSDAEEVFVCDAHNGRIQVFTTTGTFVRQFPVDAWKGDSWREPYIALLPDGSLAITDPPANRVVRYSQTGEFLGVVTPDFPGPPYTMSYPMGIAAGPNGTIYIADRGHNRILTATYKTK